MSMMRRSPPVMLRQTTSMSTDLTVCAGFSEMVTLPTLFWTAIAFQVAALVMVSWLVDEPRRRAA